ncbi:ABC transporter ATP-binding protein [Saccharomonospora glauca]|uniref:ABC-type multidrug transport system, ATPase and permease component n=1 Tax=Saccharomonospora glauca K62 TaxID=928724 RepID=I1D1Z8_9PSEU|nr:ABC transporter ATP-binding protein [Saccharomonospora glauca]EIE98972.1 ABC-type multidrug transport system, ATPase and permease component [Saccharomonospora glauca K62]
MSSERATMLRASAWRDLLTYLAPHRTLVTVGALFTMCGSLVGLTQPMMAKWIVDALGEGRAVLGPILLLTAAVVVGAALAAIGYWLLGRVAESVVLTARTSMLGRILRMRLAETGRLQPGDLMSRVTADTTLLRQSVSQTLVDALKGLLMLVAVVVAMVLLDAVLLLVTVAVLAVAALLIALVVPFFQRYSAKVQESIGDINAVLERLLGAFRTVKSSGAEPGEAEKLRVSTDRAWFFGLRLARLSGIVSAGALLAIHVSFLAVLGVGGARVASGAIPVGTLIAFLLYLFALIEPVAGLITAASTFSTGVAAIRRIREVERLEVESVGERARSGTGDPRPAALSFHDVHFAYPDGTAVHHGVSFAIPPGGLTAVVGPSGAGKSTLFSLVERFYDPVRGSITMDGKDIRDWPLVELRAVIGYVEQDAPVLAGTLRENLVMGAVEPISEDEIRAVLERTRLTELVDRLPDGLDSRVGHRGNTLSGGERQRVAIARALLRKPRLLLLDEATSQLDAVNEAALRDVVVEVAAELTVLVVAHRLSTVTKADRILVMEAGRIRAVGSHEELVASDELYRELAATQLLVAEDETVVPAVGDGVGTPH